MAATPSRESPRARQPRQRAEALVGAYRPACHVAGVGPAQTERSIRVTQPDWVDIHCQPPPGASHRPTRAPDGPVPLPAEQPYPKDGLAASPAHRIERIEELSRRRPWSWMRWRRCCARPSIARSARPRAGPITRFREARESSSNPRSRRAYLPLENRRATTMSRRFAPIECWASRRTSVSRRRSAPAGSCATAAPIRPLMMFVDLLPCNRYHASYMLPLGVMRGGGPALLACAVLRVGPRAVLRFWNSRPKKVLVMVST